MVVIIMKNMGEKEGRKLKLLSGLREEKVLRFINKKGVGLEIGPSHCPIASKRAGFNIEIIDHLTASELREKYRDHLVNIDNIEEVDYVWRGQPLDELIGKQGIYDYIIASHVIEHVPDLISFLQQCERLLNLDGVLSLAIPDKRYCFDYFRWPSSTGDVLQSYTEHRIIHTPGTIFDHFSNAVKIDEMSFMHTLNDAKLDWECALQSEEYVDVHNWRFTPSSFRIILHDLQVLNLTELAEMGGSETTGCEFFITLGKNNKNIIKYNRIELAKSMIKEMTEMNSEWLKLHYMRGLEY